MCEQSIFLDAGRKRFYTNLTNWIFAMRISKFQGAIIKTWYFKTSERMVMSFN